MIESETFTYLLPDENNNAVEYQTPINSLIVIGANGSGKSKLGAWIERQNGEGVHRVAAQRSLNFSEHTPLKSYEESSGEFFYGSPEKNFWRDDKSVRWGWGESDTTKLLDDYDAVLSALLAHHNNEVQAFYNDCILAESEGAPKPHTPLTVLNKLYAVWESVFPHRKLTMEDTKFLASSQDRNAGERYSATKMSDGERSVLYLAAQVLCIPENKTIVVDEPEIHLHPSIMGHLWRALEAVRPDCLFIFITHDVQFSALHESSTKIWVKEYDGVHWNWDFIENGEFPEALLIELLGNRKNVLFVEGGQSSFDMQLYSCLYPDFYIVPCGSCRQVLSNTKAFASTNNLHELRAFGIIDRDYRNDEDLVLLESKGIYALEVAEVENLFLVEPLLRLMATRFACDKNQVIENVKHYIVQERFAQQIEKQVQQATVFSLKEKLSSLDITDEDNTVTEESFRSSLSEISFSDTYEIQNTRFYAVLDSNDYAEVLRIFNEKNLAQSIGRFFGIKDSEYCCKVMSLLQGELQEDIRDALSSYIPNVAARFQDTASTGID